jgi:hypothetical protein
MKRDPLTGEVFLPRQLPVLGLEGLLLTKQGMRDKDRADAAVLRRAIELLEQGQ